MSLIGILGEVGMGDVLRLFSEDRKTGVLTVTSSVGRAALRFHKGALAHASAGSLSGEAAVLDLFGWPDGQLTFAAGAKAGGAAPNVGRPVAELIEEGQRVGAARHRLHALAPSDRVVFQLARGPADESARVSIGVGEWRVIRLLDGMRDLKEVVHGCGMARTEVLRILFDLAESGFVQRVEVQRVLRVQTAGARFAREDVELDQRLRDDWARAAHFEAGVTRVQVRTLGGRSVVVTARFRPGLGRDIRLPRTTITALALRDGEDVHVRPVS